MIKERQNKKMEYRMPRSKHRKPSLFQKIISIVSATILLGIIAACVAFALLVDTTTWESFDPSSLTNISQTLYVYDKDGAEVAGVYNKENRTYVSLDQVPDHVVKAFVAIEDARFYEHNGIDFRRFFGSVIANLKSMSFSQGFSTISQQLIKNTHLTPEKTINRKVQEMYLAVKLEQEYTKDQIMEMYLNYIYFGNGAYGIEAAAQSYFDKSASELTISEGAMLAGVIKATSYYAPHIDFDRSMERRNVVLEQMYKYEFITEAQYQEALQNTPKLVVSRPSNTEYGQFVDYVLEQASLILDMSYEEMTSSGYKIYTTMDSVLQKNAQNHFSNPELFPETASDGIAPEAAAVVVDAKTGAVKVLVAGRDYQARGMNRAVDARRQPGSAIKPILVYGPAIDRFGYNGATLIEDKAININGYAPNNYDNTFSGWVSLRKAVSSSINIPAVVVLNDIGVENGKYYAMSSGIPFDESDDHLSLALGGFKYGVTPLELAGAYQPYANNGTYNAPYVIEKIEDSYGVVMYEHAVDQIQVVDSSTAFMMTDILKTAAVTGTAHRVKIDGIEMAGKTGTVSFQGGKGVNDAWTVAYTTEDIVAVWNGFDMPSDIHYMSSSATGGRYPALMAHEIFKDLYSDHTPDDFTVDPGVLSVKLDKIMYEEYNTIALASEYTPREQYFYEYFKVEDQPTNLSQFWDKPLKVTDLSVELDFNDNPFITFTPPQEYMIYTLVRQLDTEENTIAVPVATFEGINGLISYTDTNIEPGTYKYFVIPYNPNITLENGEHLAGDYSDYVSIVVPQEDKPGWGNGRDNNGWNIIWPWDKNNEDESPTATPEITPTPEVSASPTDNFGGIGGGTEGQS